MEDVWLDALHHSISSSSWLDAARAWVDANCAAFEPDPSEYSCGQFQLFAEFRELADKLLGRVLDELGCNSPSAEDALVAALRRYAYADESAARGPRDAAARKCLATLIDLDDFERFAKMMAARNYELEQETDVIIERARQPRSEPVTPGHRRGADSLESKHSLNSPPTLSSPWGSTTQDIAECKAGEDAKPSASDLKGDERSEAARWQAQCAVASSLLESAPSLEEQDAPLLEWAEAVMRARESQAAGADATVYRTLVRQRFRAELAVAQHRLATERLARQGEIDAASSREAMLAAALERADAVQRAAASRRAACLRFSWLQQSALQPADASAGGETRSGLAADSIEALYWHVKDCCSRGADFARADDAHALFAFFDGLARKSGAPLGDDAVGVVPLCAQWVMLEEELRHLQRSVRELVGGEDERRGEAAPTPVAASAAPTPVAASTAPQTPTSGPWSGATTWAFENGVRDGETAWYEQYDDGIGHHYYVNTFTGHSQWEPPECGYTPLVASDEAVASADDPMASLPKSPRPGATTADDAASVAPFRPVAADDRVPEKGDAMVYRPTGERVSVVKVHYEDEDPYYTVQMADGREKQTVRSKLTNLAASADEGKAREAERPWFKSLEICTSPEKDGAPGDEGAPPRTPAAVPPPVGLPPTGAAMSPHFLCSAPFLTEAAGTSLPSTADAKEPELPLVLPTPTPTAGLLSQESLQFLRQRVLSSGIPTAQPGIQMAQPGVQIAQPGVMVQQPALMMHSGVLMQPGMVVQPGAGMMAPQGVMMQPSSMTHAGMMQPGVAMPVMMQQQQPMPMVMMQQQPQAQQPPPIQVQARVVPS